MSDTGDVIAKTEGKRKRGGNKMTLKDDLIKSFTEAKEVEARYIFTEIDLGYPATEIIVNPIENVDQKLKYLCETYDDDLRHPKAPIGIVSFGYCDNLGQLEYNLINFEGMNKDVIN